MKQDNQKILRHNARDLQNHILSPSVVSEEDTPLLAGIRGSGRGAKDYVIGADDVPIPTTKSRQYVAALSATLGPFALGTVLAWTAPNGTKLVRSDLNPGPGLLTEEQWTWIGSLVNVGAGIAVLAVGYLVDAVGRKRTMLGLVAPFTAGWLLIAWADQAVPLYYVGRLLTGMAGGAFTLTVPIYISEIAESDIRGVLGTYFQLMFTCGILFVYVLGAVPAVSVFALNMACAAVPVLFGLIFVFMPESPVYYVKKGCGNKARRSLRWLRGKHYDPEPELQEIQDVVDLIASEKLSFSEAFKTRAARKALGVCLGLMFFQQLSGVNTVIFYVSFIFKSAGSAVQPATATVAVGVILVLSTVAATLLVDRAGRRLLLCVSGLSMAACMLALGLFFHLEEQLAGLGWLPVGAVCVFVATFNLGYGCVPWLMAGELFPLRIKGAAVSLVCLANWLLSFLVTKFFSRLLLLCGWAATFWLFGAASLLGTAFVALCVPETRGKSLEDIQRELGAGPAPDTELVSPQLKPRP
ncbi:facilitated trehalose transporter Tret1-2 homolog isoform X2 [Bacillus rossius redtenbacheri]|uniref:facilitated trehalose transporter Tret1-2 homolog isoform X2 n=1 Tax=Bacillus rossius redtenbacheri TaxID=93214 RepID=UPI002FDE1898